MSLLNLPTLENATGDVKKVFDEIKSTFGIVPNGLQIWAANPKALENQWEVVKPLMFKTQEGQKLHAMIRYLVSDENSCAYCTGSNAGMLMDVFQLSQTDLIRLQDNPSSASLTDKNKALLLLALQSFKNPDSVSKEDLQNLTDLGASEKEMFDIVHAAAQMSLANTIFKTFKVEID